ncbi:hypothetical protein JHW41_19705 [Lysobacter enzymogenes]|nr:hypothetical protein [Lysobacter enzymogenes]QQQ00295.1 hypothetical protein JHW41_19705 [Lysobacter enzymogenes]
MEAMLKQPDPAQEYIGLLEAINRVFSAASAAVMQGHLLVASAAVVGGPSGPTLLFQIATN